MELDKEKEILRIEKVRIEEKGKMLEEEEIRR